MVIVTHAWVIKTLLGVLFNADNDDITVNNTALLHVDAEITEKGDLALSVKNLEGIIIKTQDACKVPLCALGGK